MRNWSAVLVEVVVLLLFQSFFMGTFAETPTVNLGREKGTIYLSTGDSYNAVCLISATNWALTDVKVFFNDISFNIPVESCTQSFTMSLTDVSYYCSIAIANFTSMLSNSKGTAFCEIGGIVSSLPTSRKSASRPFEVFVSPIVSLVTTLIMEENKPINVTCKTTETNWINPIVTFSIIAQLYSTFLTCTTSDGVDGGELYTCTGTIGGFDRMFNKNSAVCVFETHTQLNAMKSSIARDLNIIFAPDIVTVGVTSALVMYEGNPFKTVCELSETTWVEPFVFFGIESKIFPVILTNSCTNTTEANGGYKYSCPIILPGSDVTSSLVNKNAACIVYERSTFEAKSALPKIVKVLIKVTPIIVPSTTTQPFVTQVSTTQVSTTQVSTTQVPTTQVSTTQVPTTQVPTTQVPTTQIPTTQVPTTQVPTTSGATITFFKAQISTTSAPKVEVYSSSEMTTISTVNNQTKDISTVVNFQTSQNKTNGVPISAVEINNTTVLQNLTIAVTNTQIPTTNASSLGVTTTDAPKIETSTIKVTTTEAPTTKVTTTEAPKVETSTTNVTTTDAPKIETSTIKVTTTEAPTTKVTTKDALKIETSTIKVTTEAPTTKVTTNEAPKVETSTIKVTTTEAPTTKVTTTEAPKNETSTTKVTTTEAPKIEISTTQVTLSSTNAIPSKTYTAKSSGTDKILFEAFTTVEEAKTMLSTSKSDFFSTDFVKIPGENLTTKSGTTSTPMLTKSQAYESTTTQTSTSMQSPLKATVSKPIFSTSSVVFLAITAVAAVIITIYLVKMVSHSLWMKKIKATDQGNWNNVIDEESNDNSFKRVKIVF